MNTQQSVSLGLNNPTFPPQNYKKLSQESELRKPDQGPSSTIIQVNSYEAPHEDCLAWSVFNTLYMNFCCLGFVALIFSVKARDRKVVGDLHGAQSYGSTAKCLNICALICSLVIFILLVILHAVRII